MLTVTLYSRADCHLCTETKTLLKKLQTDFPHRLVEIDIDQDELLRAHFGEIIPVVEVGPYRLQAPVDEVSLRATLGAASDRLTHLETIDDEAYRRAAARGRRFSRADAFSLWLSQHYLALINLLVFLYVGLPFAAPVLMHAHMEKPARVIYAVYSPLCHQLAFRSWFLFGEQPFYPRAAAGVEGVKTFGEATGLDETQLLPARKFIGNETLGYKVALCERDVAIYASILLFGLLYALTGRRLNPLSPFWWVVLGWVPIGLDGFSQLFSQVGLPALSALFPYRESTPFLRTLTGFLFGFTTAWFAIPAIEETMRDTRKLLLRKLAVVQHKEQENAL